MQRNFVFFIVCAGLAILLTGCGGSFVCGTVDDVDGNTYSTVKIGGQCWMGENMRTTKYPGGGDITKGCATESGCGGTGPLLWGDDTALYSCPPNYPDNNAEDCAAAGGAEKLGMLYQWSAAMNGSTTEGAQGICPSGWHIPTNDEYKTLEVYLGMCETGNGCADDTKWRGVDQGTQLKSGGNSSFEGLLAGYRNPYGDYDYRGAYASFWSSSPDVGDAWDRGLYVDGTKVGRIAYGKAGGFSVRCLKD